MSVDPVFGNDQVALRGPWTGDNLVKVAPTAADVASGRDRYHLDFPGNALRPKCDYEEWQQSLPTAPTAYAHVVSEQGQTALQYWFFYVYNDYNDRHEGDWEMIQLDFPAATAAAAVAVSPSEAGYAQHNGGERAAWGDAKLELVDATHPVVYPAAGSHADYFGPAVYLGRSAAQGVGCDNTRGPHRALRPTVALVPTDPVAARSSTRGSASRGSGARSRRSTTTARPGLPPTTSGITRSSGRRRAGTRRRSRSRVRSTACRVRRASSAGPSPRARAP